MAYLCYAAFLAAFASATSATETSQNNHLKLEFAVSRGNSILTADGADHGAFVSRDEFSSLDLINESTYYAATLAVGSNGDQNTVLVDTGSSDLWLMSSDVGCYSLKKRSFGGFSSMARRSTSDSKYVNSEIIKRANQVTSQTTTTSTSVQKFTSVDASTCTSLGSFNTDNSETFHVNSSAPAFSITYGDGSFANGIWGTDSVSVGSLNVSDISIAVVNDTTSDVAVLGIGLPWLEVTYSDAPSNSAYAYQNFPVRLKDTGVIKKAAYSLYLNDVGSSGSVLFGAVDHAKYTGQLQTVPIINIYPEYYNIATTFNVMLDAITLSDSSQKIAVSNSRITALLDSGTTLTHFPPPIVQSIASSLNGKRAKHGRYEVDFVYKTTSAHAIFDLSGIEISVPLSDLIRRYKSAGEYKCYLALVSSPNDEITGAPTCILGDNFLRHAYVVYDLEQLEVSLAQVNYSSNEEIDIISNSVPSAVKAPGYSSTFLDSSVTTQPTITRLTFATTTSYWTAPYTSTTTVDSGDGIPTVVLEIPFDSTSTSTWASSYTTTDIFTGTDGFETPVIVVPVSEAVSETVFSGTLTSSSVISSSHSPSSFFSISTASYGVSSAIQSIVSSGTDLSVSSAVISGASSSVPLNSPSGISSHDATGIASGVSSVDSFIYSSGVSPSVPVGISKITSGATSFSSAFATISAPGVSSNISPMSSVITASEATISDFTMTSLGWNVSFFSTSSYYFVEKSPSSNYISSINTGLGPYSSAYGPGSANSSFFSPSGLTTESGVLVSTSTNSAGLTEFLTSTFATTYCPASASSAVPSSVPNNSSSLTSETRIVVSASINASGSTVLVTDTFTTTYCPPSSSFSATKVSVSIGLTTETNVVVSSSFNASGSTVLFKNTFTTTYCPASTFSTTAITTYVTSISTGRNSGASQDNSSVQSSTITPVASASMASMASISPTVIAVSTASISSGTAPISLGEASSISQGQAALTTPSPSGAATSGISSSFLSVAQTSSITVLQGGSQALSILSAILLVPLFALL